MWNAGKYQEQTRQLVCNHQKQGLGAKLLDSLETGKKTDNRILVNGAYSPRETGFSRDSKKRDNRILTELIVLSKGTLNIFVCRENCTYVMRKNTAVKRKNTNVFK